MLALHYRPVLPPFFPLSHHGSKHTTIYIHCMWRKQNVFEWCPKYGTNLTQITLLTYKGVYELTVSGWFFSLTECVCNVSVYYSLSSMMLKCTGKVRVISLLLPAAFHSFPPWSVCWDYGDCLSQPQTGQWLQGSTFLTFTFSNEHTHRNNAQHWFQFDCICLTDIVFRYYISMMLYFIIATCCILCVFFCLFVCFLHVLFLSDVKWPCVPWKTPSNKMCCCCC